MKKYTIELDTTDVVKLISICNSAIEREKAFKLIKEQKEKETGRDRELTVELKIKSQKRANIFEIADAFERGRAEAIKEFWKRFDKVLCENIGPSKRVYWKISSDGNNLVKEMTEVK